MFKNKLKLTKKLARLVAVSAIPLGIVVASGHASAMFKLSQFRGLSAQTASTARKPVVQQPKFKTIVQEDLVKFSETELLAAVKAGTSVDVQLSEVCEFRYFELARYLIENGFAKVNDNVYYPYRDTCLHGAISGGTHSKCCEDVDRWVEFIEYLVNDCKADLNGKHYGDRPLVFSFLPWQRRLRIRDTDQTLIEHKTKALIKVFNFLLSKGMSVKSIDGCGFSFGYLLGDSPRGKSIYHSTLLNLVAVNS